MRATTHSHRKQLTMKLDGPVAPSKSCRSKGFFVVQNTRQKLLLTFIAAGSLLAGSMGCLAEVSPFEYQLSKLRAESVRFEREKSELIRHKQIENSRVASYNSELLRVVSEFQNHIADQHQHFVSRKKCRQLTKQMSELSKKIERGIR